MMPSANRWTEPLGAEDLLDGGRRDGDAKALQLADDTLIAPPRILPRQPYDQRSNV
jgi:hypothetical protein